MNLYILQGYCSNREACSRVDVIDERYRRLNRNNSKPYTRSNFDFNTSNSVYGHGKMTGMEFRSEQGDWIGGEEESWKT